MAPGTAQALQAAGVGQGAPSPDLNLPFSKAFEDAKFAIDEELSRTLEQLGYQKAQIPLLIDKVKSRMKLAHGIEMQGIDEEMISRGIYDSSIRTDDQMQASIPFQQREQDFDSEIAQMMQEIQLQESGAHTGWTRSMTELINDYMGSLYDNPPSTIDQTNDDYYEDPGYELEDPNDTRHDSPNTSGGLPGPGEGTKTKPPKKKGKTRNKKGPKNQKKSQPKKKRGRTRGRKK